MSGVSKERVTLWLGCIGLKALAGFLGQRPKPLGRARLSVINAENQQIAKQIPNFTPKDVKLGVFCIL